MIQPDKDFKYPFRTEMDLLEHQLHWIVWQGTKISVNSEVYHWFEGEKGFMPWEPSSLFSIGP